MASGKVTAIMHDTFKGTTDTNGNLFIGGNEYRKIIAIRLTNRATGCIPMTVISDHLCIKVFTLGGLSPLELTYVEGEYWYLE